MLTRNHMSLHQIRQCGRWWAGGWGGGERKKNIKHMGFKLQVDVWRRKDLVFFQRSGEKYYMEGEHWLSRDTPPPPPPRSRRRRARPMKWSGGQLLAVETALTATAELVHSAAAGANNMSSSHLRGNLPHYGCDYF